MAVFHVGRDGYEVASQKTKRGRGTNAGPGGRLRVGRGGHGALEGQGRRVTVPRETESRLAYLTVRWEGRWVGWERISGEGRKGEGEGRGEGGDMVIRRGPCA